MASHKARWGTITSSKKWVFLRLHPGAEPYITFSSVEMQANNTRPFRALLAMMLAAELDLEVDSHADLEDLLSPIPEKPAEDSPSPDPGEDKSESYKGSRGTREEPLATRPSYQDERRYLAKGPDLFVSCVMCDDCVCSKCRCCSYADRLVPTRD